MRKPWLSHVLVAILFVVAACKKEEAPSAAPTAAAQPAPAVAAVATPGVDMVKKVVRIGALNDESGPGAGIGKPFAIGKRLLARAVAGGAVKMLPEGWTIELVERDHAYNPQQSVQHYNAIKDDVLFIATSFGTPNTLPLRPMLQRDGLVAFPASNSSEMGENAYTPLLTTSYSSTSRTTTARTAGSAGSPPPRSMASRSSTSRRSPRGRRTTPRWSPRSRRRAPPTCC